MFQAIHQLVASLAESHCPMIRTVLLTDRAWPDSTIELQTLATAGVKLVESPSADEATLMELARTCDAIATNWAKVTPAVIEASPNLKVISRMGIGLDNIAIEAATARGIPVANCPDYCVQEVADHALALLLSHARKIAFFHHRMKQGEYNLQAGLPLKRIAGQTLGLIGLGKTAQNLVPKAQALGLKVIVYTPSGNGYGLGLPMVSLEELLNTADFVSLHAPLTPATRNLMSTPQFQLMKPNALLINTSRGGLVDELALKLALDQRLLAGAALDVFNPEPCDPTQSLFQDERVITTPHVAFVSEESLAQMRREAMEHILQVFAGERPRHLVNPAAYGA